MIVFEPVQKKLVRGSGGPGWAGSWAGSCDGSTAIEGNPFVEQFGKGMPLMDQLAHGSVFLNRLKKLVWGPGHSWAGQASPGQALALPALACP